MVMVPHVSFTKLIFSRLLKVTFVLLCVANLPYVTITIMFRAMLSHATLQICSLRLAMYYCTRSCYLWSILQYCICSFQPRSAIQNTKFPGFFMSSLYSYTSQVTPGDHFKTIYLYDQVNQAHLHHVIQFTFTITNTITLHTTILTA